MAQVPPHYVMRTAFCFDELRLVFTPIPKAGSTAILGALSEVVGLSATDFAHSRKLEASRALAVHDGSLWGPRYRLASRSNEELDTILGSQDWLKVTVVREPARRLWSAWVSKVLVRDPRFVAAFGEDWFPPVPSSAADVLKAFRAFVRMLPRAGSRDAHWLPQAELAGVDTVAYGHLGRLEDLGRTAQVLAAHLHARRVRFPRLRRSNAGMVPFTPAVFDPLTLEVCTRWTKPDRVAFGYEALEPTSMEPDDSWFAAVEASLPALRAVIERNERIGDLCRLLDVGEVGSGLRRLRAVRRA